MSRPKGSKNKDRKHYKAVEVISKSGKKRIVLKPVDNLHELTATEFNEQQTEQMLEDSLDVPAHWKGLL